MSKFQGIKIDEEGQTSKFQSVDDPKHFEDGCAETKIEAKWRDKVKASVNWFRSPFSDDILLSYIDTERQMTRVAGQTLATEVVNLQKELIESAQATLQMAKIASDHKETIKTLEIQFKGQQASHDLAHLQGAKWYQQLQLAIESLKRIRNGLSTNFVRVEMLTKDLASKTLEEIEAIK